VTVFKSRLKTSSSPGLSLFPFLDSTLPGLSASEVTSLWRYTNPFIIIIIIIGGGGGARDSRQRIAASAVWQNLQTSVTVVVYYTELAKTPDCF